MRGFVVPVPRQYSRKDLDDLVERGEAARRRRARVGAAARTAGSRAPALKAAGEEAIRRALELAGAAPADLLLMAAGPHEPTSKLLGQLRLNVAKSENLLDPNRSSSSGSWTSRCSTGSKTRSAGSSCTIRSPRRSRPIADRLESDPGSVRARAYDLVLNGSEIGGGSIRIHDQRLQRLIFKLLGMSDEEAKAALRLLRRRARVRHAAARRHRARARPYRRDPGGRAVDPRRHRVSENRAGGRSDGGRAVAGRAETAARAAHPHRIRPSSAVRQRDTIACNAAIRRRPIPPATVMRKIQIPDEGAESLFGTYDENLKQLEVAVQRAHPHERPRTDRRRGARPTSRAPRKCSTSCRR